MYFKCILMYLKFNKPLVMNKKHHEYCKSSAKSWICKNAYEDGKVKLKIYDHIPRKYRQFKHQKCNLNHSLRRKICAVFHNLENYDSHLIFQKIGKYKLKLNVIPKALENS